MSGGGLTRQGLAEGPAGGLGHSEIAARPGRPVSAVPRGF